LPLCLDPPGVNRAAAPWPLNAPANGTERAQDSHAIVVVDYRGTMRLVCHMR
jgi:hypothetical protein